MSFYVVDCEADGPVPGLYSMVSFGAVKVDDNLDKTFYGEVRPISELWIPEALAISNVSRNQHENFNEPKIVMQDFAEWLKETSVGQPILITDNPAFDFAFISYYFHNFTGSNPFGFSARRIGDLYCGMVKDSRARWKHLRKTAHTHAPVDDARGNAEVLLHMRDNMGLKIKFK